jgi:hypothetical protein
MATVTSPVMALWISSLTALRLLPSGPHLIRRLRRRSGQRTRRQRHVHTHSRQLRLLRLRTERILMVQCKRTHNDGSE